MYEISIILGKCNQYGLVETFIPTVSIKAHFGVSLPVDKRLSVTYHITWQDKARTDMLRRYYYM